jgi:hypothetical protein
MRGVQPANQRLKLTGAAILVSRGMKVLQAAPAAYHYRSATRGHMTAAQQSALKAFLHSLVGVCWVAHCGEADPMAVVADDLVDAWDNWNSEMLAVWSPQTHALEEAAISELSDGGVEAIFAAVSQAVDAPLREGATRYFEKRPADSEVAVTNTDLGLWPEWLDSAKRDLCWAAIEAVLGRPGFFSELLPYYRGGRARGRAVTVRVASFCSSGRAEPACCI